jgi:Fic/DOC family
MNSPNLPSNNLPLLLNIQNERIHAFLEKSKELEEGLVEEPAKERNYFTAFIESQQNALHRRFIKYSDLMQWHACLASDNQHQLDDQKQIKLNRFIERLNQNLSSMNSSNEGLKVELIADTWYAFNKLEPFEKGNGLMARLLANFVTTWFRSPILVFCPHEVNFEQNYQDLNQMCLYIAKKFREAVINSQGQLAMRQNTDTLNSLYVDSEGHRLTVQWNNLVEAEKRWSQKPLKSRFDML